MSSNVQTDSMSQLTSARRGALAAYRWLVLGFLLLGAVQIFLAAWGRSGSTTQASPVIPRSPRTARSGSRWAASRW
jgi:hypothetical protein